VHRYSDFFTFTTPHITINRHSEEAVKNHLPECRIRTYDGKMKFGAVSSELRERNSINTMYIFSHLYLCFKRGGPVSEFYSALLKFVKMEKSKMKKNAPHLKITPELLSNLFL